MQLVPAQVQEGGADIAYITVTLMLTEKKPSFFIYS